MPGTKCYASAGSSSTHCGLMQCEHAVKRAVADAKDRWIKKTDEAAKVDQDGCEHWKLLKELQNVYCGRQPVKASGVMDECGRCLSEPAKVVARWL